ncbi:MAG: thioredoxin family protein [Candidatus Obscuribacter sp.]|nr:thioredoxin family protein [Candidatus Obscuribacter sp.]
MTYESESEAKVLKSYWRPGADLENTLFTFLDPYGRPLMPGTRSPGFVFQDPRQMALSMDELARRFGARGKTGETQNLPVVASVRLALNVAAADKQPLAVVVSNSSQERRTLEKKLSPLAWKQDLMGRLTYASGSLSELRNIAGISLNKGYVFVLPDEFGTSGQVLGQLTDTASPADLERALKYTLDQHKPSTLSHHEHVQLGHRQGLKWTSAIPVTDPGSLRHEQEMRLRPPPGRN